ncbi:MAG: DNA repair protein RecN [Coriobacteriales bacterium]|jgi:DNA repair protein RecN (Recombination protein N)|nr:DNA repair protein RecN [Coriobacteriales bacterium]
MLDELHVSNLALIKDATISFGSGLTVLTGETGAGKTALLTSLKLLIGERGEARMVRDGSDEARVEARFTSDEDERIASRRVSKDGRSRCSFNDAMCTVKTLSEQIGPFVDLHGQHEHQSLLKPAMQLAAIDAYGADKVAPAKSAYDKAWTAYNAAANELKRIDDLAHTSVMEREQAQFTLHEIDAVDPRAGEYEELEDELPRLRNGEDLARGANAALEALRDEGKVVDSLGAASSELGRLSGVDGKLDEIAQQLDSIIISTDDITSALRDYRDSVSFDPNALEESLDRLGALEGLKKRFGPRMEDVFEAHDRAVQLLASTDDIEGQREIAQAALTAAEADLRQSAEALASARKTACEDFARELTGAVADLAMQNASFNVDIRPLGFERWNATGSCEYELLYKPAPSAKPHALAKIASGGELSRVMLALKTIMHDADADVTLVFDEIDSGIGGTTAQSVAARLKALASTHQVIVVTHLAQIAAVANKQWVVGKLTDDNGDVYTSIKEVCGDERVLEVARMLAGSTDDVSVEHARALLGDNG